VRVRHCPATVSDGRSLHEATGRPGGKAQAVTQYVVSQETGLASLELGSALARAKEDIMRESESHPYARSLLMILLVCLLTPTAFASTAGIVRGRVLDPLGASVPNASVTLLQNEAAVRAISTDQEGNFEFSPVDAGRYRVRVEAAGFARHESAAAFLSRGATLDIGVVLQVGTLRQQIVVSDTGTALPESEVGASVSVIDNAELGALHKLDVFDALRLVPGVEVAQTGQRGGSTSVFVRGGDADFNKVLIDGIPANDIGGEFDFANLSASGVDQLEILRGPNSVLYGSDAFASVINIASRRGSSTTPEFTYSADAGNFHTFRQEASLGGAFRQFDYFSDFTRLDSQNSLPNSSFHNATYAGNFGWAPSGGAQIRFTLRHSATGAGDPNAQGLYGIADDSFQREQDTYAGITAQSQTTARWHNLLRLTSTRLQFRFDNPAPTGTPFDPFGFGPNYLGEPATVCGANGYCTTGQAILDFGGAYPELFDSRTTVRSLDAQSDYTVGRDLSASFGFRYDHEAGFTESSGTRSPTHRNNFGYFLEAHGNLRRRAFVTAGVGFEDNAVFGFAATPRVSLAYYPRQPSSNTFLGFTKLRFNFGTGIKEPSIFHEGSSLFNLLSTLPDGPALISKFSVAPIGAERSRSVDFGLDQGFWGGRARLGITFFHDRFFDLIEFVDKSALPGLGVSPDVAAALPFGATINSDSFRSVGTETEFEASFGHALTVKGEYTYLDAVVTRSFASSAQSPAVNPAFPNIPIGAFSPLVGGRPFLRAPHSGSLVVDYAKRKFGVDLTGYFAGASDDSTFLTDGFFGNTMLLPNRNLLRGYQLVSFSGWYTARRGFTLYASLGNVLSQHYEAAFGYPALPFTFRTGVRFTLGGEAWKRR
jgi:vitamin B12 transporter